MSTVVHPRAAPLPAAHLERRGRALENPRARLGRRHVEQPVLAVDADRVVAERDERAVAVRRVREVVRRPRRVAPHVVAALSSR